MLNFRPLVSASLILFCITPLQAGLIGTEFTYQGELKLMGVEVNEVCDFNFGLWDAAVGGSEVAPAVDVLGVPVEDGKFTVALDFGPVAFDGNDRWLEVAVVCPTPGGGLTTLAPRQELTATPHASFALEAGAMDWSALSGIPAGLDDGDDVNDADADPANELQNLGEVLMQGNDADLQPITNLAAPTAPSDAATRSYVDFHEDGDADNTNELQNLFETINGDAGSTTADSQTDTLNIVGSGSVSTSVVGDTLTVDGAGITEAVANPVLVESLTFASIPDSLFVSGSYAYVVDLGTDDLKIIDVSDPASPELIDSLVLGANPSFVVVSGRYAYVVESGPDMLKVIDVSDPSTLTEVGSLMLGANPNYVYVSGHYAYATNADSDNMQVIDVSDPTEPSSVGTVMLGTNPQFVFVSGRYAYVVDNADDELTVIDVSDPTSPTVAGSLMIGGDPRSVYVSGRYAYVVDAGSDDFKVIDVSDPSMPGLVTSMPLGAAPTSLHVSGRYAYVVDAGSDDLKVIDIQDPGTPTEVASLDIGSQPVFVSVSGRHAYVIDRDTLDLKVIEVSGAELPSLAAHSLEAGNIQVRNDVVAQGQIQVSGGLNVGAGGIFSDGNVGISGTVAIANDIVPTSSPANLVQLYAEDDAASSELKVRDEAGNVTTLSPHNFSLLGEPSEPMAWSFYSENARGRINVDMLRAIRLIETMSGQKLVHIECHNPADGPHATDVSGAGSGCDEADIPATQHPPFRELIAPLMNAVNALQAENDMLQAHNEAMERRLATLERKLD